MMFTQIKQKQIQRMILGCFCLLAFLLAACRSASSTIDVKAEIEPEPIVGEIVTLRIEAISEKFSGNNVIAISMSDEINLVSHEPEWQETIPEDKAQVVGGATKYGEFVINEPQSHELSICVTQPGDWVVYVTASVFNSDSKVIDWDESQLHIVSTADSAEVIPSSDYSVRQPPLGSTRAPTPEPVTVSAECSGER